MFDARTEDREYAGGAAASESWREVDRQLRRIAKRNAASAADEARWLLAAYREKVHARVGCGSFQEYVERVLGYGPRECRERLRMAIALEELPLMQKALARGELCYSAVRELTRVATAETEAAWLDAAEGKTVGEIGVMVKGRDLGALPTDPVDPDLRTTVVRYELPPQVYAQLREVERDVATQLGRVATDAEVMAELCARYFAPAKDDESNKPPYQIALTVCEQCERAWQDGAGRAIEVGHQVAEQARCDAQMIGRVDGNARSRASRTIPPALRRQVLRRDHGRCVVPGCRAARHIEVHHLHERGQGGPNEADNLVALCRGHHSALHHGQIRITGAPGHREFHHADGRRFGTPPAASTPVPAASELDAQARSALTTLGFKPGEAWRAVAHATTHAGRDAPIEAVLTAALRFLGPAR